MFLFRKRNALGRAVNRRARCKDEAFHSTRPGRFEQMQSSGNIGVVIDLRLLNRRPNSDAGGKVKNRMKFLASKQIGDAFTVAEIEVMQRDFLFKRRDILSLDPGIVEIVKIVDDGEVVTVSEQFFDQMRADETSAASDENSHQPRI